MLISCLEHVVKRVDERAGLKLHCGVEAGESIVSILRSDYRWRKVRNAHIVGQPRCQMCFIVKQLEVHHIKPWHIAEQLRYERENLITLCRPCHYRFGHLLNWHDSNPFIRDLCTVAKKLNLRIVS